MAMNEKPEYLESYSADGLATAEAGLFEAWDALDKFHDDLVVVGGLAVYYHTKDTANPIYRSTSTLDVDFGFSLGADAGLAGTAKFDLLQLGYEEDAEHGRMSRKTDHGMLHVDFLTEHPPARTGSRNVSGVIASICPGINRALECREYVAISGNDRFGDERTLSIPLAGIGPLLVLKLNAFDQRKNVKRDKDAYDILVAVSSYSKGASAAISAFHDERETGNPAMGRALQTLEEHFTKTEDEGPVAACRFRFGNRPLDESGLRLQEDLVKIVHALLGR